MSFPSTNSPGSRISHGAAFVAPEIQDQGDSPLKPVMSPDIDYFPTDSPALLTNNTPIKSKLSERLSILRNKNPLSNSTLPRNTDQTHSSESPLGTRFQLDVPNPASAPASVPPPSSGGVNSTNPPLLSSLFKRKNISNDNLSSSDHNSDSLHERKSIIGMLNKGVRRLSRSSSDESEVDIEVPKSPIASTHYEEESFSMPLDKKSISPQLLDTGIEMLRITHKKKIKRLFKLDLDKDILLWNNKSSSFLEIEKIKSIRIGDDAKNYREEFKVSSDYKDLWITIIYYNNSKSNNIKALHMIATSRHDYDIFVSTLKNLLFFKRQLSKSFSSITDNEILTKLHWNNKASDHERLSFDGVLKLTTKLHVHIDPEYLRKLFDTIDDTKRGYLDFEEFKRFVSLLRERREFVQIFEAIPKSDTSKLHLEEFSNFLTNIQKEIIGSGSTVRIFSRFAKNKDYMDLQDFGQFLLSSYTAPHKAVDETFARPLNEYFISSSHNTYLLGRQLNGNASVEGYIRALQRGCRCIEIDVWDGDSGPIVTHGRTLTSSVDFQTVVETIRKYSFITSPYPVILSLEIKCGIPSQLAVVRILKDVLGDLLITEPISTKHNKLPSPSELKHRIIVKVKKSKVDGSSKSVDSAVEFGGSSSASMSSSFSEDGGLTPLQHAASAPSITKIIPRKRTSVKITPELSSLGVYVVGTKYRNFSLPESKTFNHCFSFSDKNLTKIMGDKIKLAAVFKHNRNFLMRVYPSFYRFNSSNFSPLTFWEMGTQMVATNWQVFDLGQQLNESLFNIGSNAGYVLKPPNLRMEKSKLKNQDISKYLAFKNTNRFTIEIISCQQLPRPKDMKDDAFDTYIELEAYSGEVLDASVRTTGSTGSTGSSAGAGSVKLINPLVESSDSSSSSDSGRDSDSVSVEEIMSLNTPSAVFKTPVVPRNAFNPVWNQKCDLRYLSNDNNLVFLRFLVKCFGSDHSESIIGVHCCKLDYLKHGFRHLPLYDMQGEEFIYSTLFVNVDYGAA